jgi:hypothetical protein
MLMENCAILTFFFVMAPFLKGGIEYNQYSFGEKCCQTHQRSTFFSIQTQVLESFFLT